MKELLRPPRTDDDEPRSDACRRVCDEPACTSREKSLARNVLETQRVRPTFQIANLKATFASSSPLTPATQSVSLGYMRHMRRSSFLAGARVQLKKKESPARVKGKAKETARAELASA
jgi:hypothetical protein